MDIRSSGRKALSGAAYKAVELLTGKMCCCGYSDAELDTIAAKELKKLREEQRFLRGLFWRAVLLPKRA